MESVDEVHSYVGTTSTSHDESRKCQDLDSDGDDDELDKMEAKWDKTENSNTKRIDKQTKLLDANALMDSCKYIPMRLTVDERRRLQVLENTLEVSDYTDTVDVLRGDTSKRILNGLVDVLSISCGLTISNNVVSGERLVKDRQLADNLPYFKDLFEIGRRYKIMNPSKMRNTYGKLMFLLQDSKTPAVQQQTKMSLVKEILMVYNFLEDRQCLQLLSDPLVPEATVCIDDTVSSSKAEAIKLAQKKEKAITGLITSYTSDQLTAEDIERVLSSISDYNTYISFNVHPVEKMINLLKDNFDPANPQPGYSLALTSAPKAKKSSFSSFGLLSSGSGYSSRYTGDGACLTHDHATQFRFVLQSLSLWREIMCNMTRLWTAADKDLLHMSYHLRDTGQGLNRLQQCPNVRNLMESILSSVKRRSTAWVGLSVVHLGDRDVPNALVFIDKYSQVPRILAPIAACIESLPDLVHDEPFHAYVREEWQSLDGLRLQILSDFFKHGFDGSGDDGGSCIDGRLTSAWNWCSKLAKKPYYYVFMFTGFQGFDGDWKD